MTTDPQDIEAPLLNHDNTWTWLPMIQIPRSFRYRLANGEFLDMAIPYHRDIRAAAEILNAREEANKPEWTWQRITSEENFYHHWI